jgi:hypothetical protein
MFFWFLNKSPHRCISVVLSDIFFYSIHSKSSFGLVELCIQSSRELIFSGTLKFLRDSLKSSFSSYSWHSAQTKHQWSYTNNSSEYISILYFLTKTAAEFYQNNSSKSFFVVHKSHLRVYLYPQTRRPFFLGAWRTSPIHVTGQARPKERGQRIVLARDILILRKGTRVAVESQRFLSWQPGSVLPHQSHLTATRRNTSGSRDITSGIPRIEALLELRSQTGVSSLLEGLYQCFVQNGFLSGVAVRKALHFSQRVLIDRVQRIYQTNGVILDDKHLELTIRPISFVQTVQDNAVKSYTVQGDSHLLEILERINWNRALKNWQKKKILSRMGTKYSL